MYPTLNICSAVLPSFNFINMLEIVEQSGTDGIELRIHDMGHCSLQQLEKEGELIHKRVSNKNINLPILNSYIGIEDEDTVNRLLACCEKMNIPKIRFVLPRSCNASVSQQANINELLPSYNSTVAPNKLVPSLRKALKKLEIKARQHGVKVLLELHWGTVMSSFSSAYTLINDLDPAYIALTFDPANMLVEGKEDWEYGLNLVKNHIDNVHLKNMSWIYSDQRWQWTWDSMDKGMVEWPYLLSLLINMNYSGEYSIEDFQTPQQSKYLACDHLSKFRKHFMSMYTAVASEEHTRVA